MQFITEDKAQGLVYNDRCFNLSNGSNIRNWTTDSVYASYKYCQCRNISHMVLSILTMNLFLYWYTGGCWLLRQGDSTLTVTDFPTVLARLARRLARNWSLPTLPHSLLTSLYTQREENTTMEKVDLNYYFL